MYLRILRLGAWYRCTGFMISPNTVATAGHCLHFQVNGTAGWADQVIAYPGYTGSAAPYGSCSSVRLLSVNGWVTSKKTDYNYGAVKLNCTIGNATGTLGYRSQASSLNGLAVRIQGYPADKGAGQWGHDGKVFRTNTYTLLSDPTWGFDGAPLFDANRYAVAIYTGTVNERIETCNGDICSGYTATFTRAMRITSEVFNNLQTWRNM